MVVGIDFDNTLVSYDEVFLQRARDLGFIKDSVNLRKQQVRDQIRLLPEGEMLWQQVQAYVYTKGMIQASLIDGVRDFFQSCKESRVQTYIVSHKTMYASFDSNQINLRDTAMEWMTANGFFDATVLGLNKAQVYFESTRLEKIERIKQLDCTHFIDDLTEVFMENEFPSNVKKILYSSEQVQTVREDIVVINSWEKIHEYFFN